ncbi:MAG: hypothetical protein WC947_10630 [Elusimicrobiota bacterium]
MKKYKFHLLCCNKDKKCKFKQVEGYRFYCTDYKEKIKCDNAISEKILKKEK